MTLTDAIGLAVSAALLVHLVVALLRADELS